MWMYVNLHEYMWMYLNLCESMWIYVHMYVNEHVQCFTKYVLYLKSQCEKSFLIFVFINMPTQNINIIFTWIEFIMVSKLNFGLAIMD